MNKQDLIKANDLQQEIDELESFIYSAEKVWTGKIIKMDSKYIFKSSAYGVFESKEYNMNTEVKNKVLDVLRDHLKDLKEQLESL